MQVNLEFELGDEGRGSVELTFDSHDVVAFDGWIVGLNFEFGRALTLVDCKPGEQWHVHIAWIGHHAQLINFEKPTRQR